MTMTKKLADSLMDDLACVAISAQGLAIYDAEGVQLLDEDRKLIEEYARSTFIEILQVWEKVTGEKWEIEQESEG